MQTIGVIGAGAWGTALAQAFAKGGRDVTLWAREPEVTRSFAERRENSLFLPGVELDGNLKVTNDLGAAAKCGILLMVTPAQHLRATLQSLAPGFPAGKPLVICAKGIELESGLLLSQVAAQVLPDAALAVMTGPTFAAEIARGLPAAATIATADKALGENLQEVLGVRNFRPYVTDDLIGAQLGGAVKNVIAIACGIVHGRGLGESARAALLTRGVAEISRLAVAMGGRKETLLGMCGIGDLMLTCSSMQSRNFSLGAALGESRSLEDVLKSRTAVTEGIYTARAALTLAKKNAVDMPITEAVNKCLNEGVPIDEAVEQMLNRPFKYEMSAH